MQEETGKVLKQKQVNLLCFNPECPFSKNRYVSVFNQHSKNQSCRPWFYSVDDLLVHNRTLLTDLKNQKSGLFIDFVRQPIQSLKKVSSLVKLNWKHKVSEMFQQVWSQLSNQLQLSQKLLIQQIEKYLESAKIYDSITKVLSNGVNEEIMSKDLTQLMKRSRIPMQPIEIFHPEITQTLLVSIKEAFKNANDSLTNLEVDLRQQTLSLNSTSQKTSIEEQMRKFEMWISEEVDNPFSKVQVLAATFGVIPNSYTIQGKNVGLECFLCRENLTIKVPDNNKKNAKKIVTKDLLDHLMTAHQKEVFTNYRKKISKSLIKEFTMDQIIEEIKFHKNKRIQIIDRENSGTYVAEENGQFIFQVVSKRNVSLARGNYVVAQSIAKDAADILFNMKNMTVRLVTNDHFGTTIEEICECLKYDFKVISRLKR